MSQILSVETPQPIRQATRPHHVLRSVETPAPGEATSLALFSDNGQAYSAMLAAIDAAAGSVHLETYTFRDDFTGQRFGAALIRAAERGAKVQVLMDWFGSFSTGAAFVERLREGGVDVRLFNPLQRLASAAREAVQADPVFRQPSTARAWPRFFLSYRDHRKLLAIDGRVGFATSMNIGDEYLPADEGGPGWHDTMVRLEGPAVHELDEAFREAWEFAGSGRPWFLRPRTRDWKRIVTLVRAGRLGWPGPGQLRVIRSGDWRNRGIVNRFYREALRRARQRVTLVHPYFVPGRSFLRELRRCRRRGVEVRLMLSDRRDVTPVWYAARHLFDELLRWGVEIWLWRPSQMHSKVVVVDGEWSTIGSYNLDKFSEIRNLELILAVNSAGVAGELEERFEQDKADCRRVDLPTWERRSLLQRLLERVFYFFRYWL